MERSRKREDLGAGRIRICILGILSSDRFQKGGSANKIMRALPRTQSPDRMKLLLLDLDERGLIQTEDLSHAHVDLKNYQITEKGKKVLEKYFDPEFRDVTDLLVGVKETTYLDLKSFWEKYGKSFQKA